MDRATPTGPGGPRRAHDPDEAGTPTGVTLDRVHDVVARIGVGATPRQRAAARPADPPARTDEVTADEVLAALVLLRHLRAGLAEWEPRLIDAARQRGASWVELAPALGVASRQAAERRYLRLRPAEHDDPHRTGDSRVRAERDRRAGDRAVARWARDNGADLRQLAGQITALTDLDPAARLSLNRLHHALGAADPTALVRLLSDAQRHLWADHRTLAGRVDAVARHVDEVRRSTQRQRAAGRS